MDLSIVTTMYQSAPYLEEFYRRITIEAKRITDNYEIIFVNDGSPDNSLETAISIHKRDNKVVIIDLSRNFGHHKAMMTGLAQAKGNFVFLIDSDLEEKPEWLEYFWSELSKDHDLDVIYGVQEKRKGNFTEKILGSLFYKMFNYITDIQVPRNLVTARLMRKAYVSALVNYKEREIFLAGIWADTGFNQKPVIVKKLNNSPTTYTFRKKISIAVDSITAFSSKPLKIIFYTGLFISLISLSFVIKILIQKVFGNISIAGWTSLIASVWLIGGMIIFCIGVVGIYLSIIFFETKNRPYSIIKRIYERK